MVIVTSWLGQYICHKGEGVVLKLERKTHTRTQVSEPKCLDIDYTGWEGRVAKRQELRPKCGTSDATFFPPCDRPVWWSEVVPESRWCFVCSQTGHDQTVLP